MESLDLMEKLSLFYIHKYIFAKTLNYFFEMNFQCFFFFIELLYVLFTIHNSKTNDP